MVRIEVIEVIETDFSIININLLCNTLAKVPLTEGITFCANFNQPPTPFFASLGLLASAPNNENSLAPFNVFLFAI